MNHKSLVTSFHKKLKKTFNIPFHYYKIPDTRGLGGLRPYDGYVVINGVFFAFEAKTKTDSLEKHQGYYLAQVERCGGYSVLVEEGRVPEAVNKILLILGELVK
jgi:hypothetical protein